MGGWKHTYSNQRREKKKMERRKFVMNSVKLMIINLILFASNMVLY